jgi:spore coat polysaccharide biosynthesis protein SpsF (cytidylyltransferase family)
MYNNEKKFKLYNITNKKNLSHIRCTLDRENDFLFLKKIILSIDKQPILLDDVLNIINNFPDLLDINKNYIQNEGYLKSLNDDKKSFNN